jgi:hypothetical protein
MLKFCLTKSYPFFPHIINMLPVVVIKYIIYFFNLIPADYAKNFTMTMTMLNDVQNSLRTYSK